MKLFRSGLWVNFTLFFFVWVLLFPSAYADQSAVPPVFEATPANLTLSSDTSVYYVTPEEARRLEHTFLKRGYQVKRGTPEQLAQLRDHRSDTIRLAKSNITQTDQADDDTDTETKKQQQKKDDRSRPAPTSGNGVGNVDLNVGHAHGGGGGGGGGDAAAVLFVLIGVVVVAVFVIYTLKYLVDIANGKEYDYWWDLGAQQTYLITDKSEHGALTSAKLASGYIADHRAYIGLVGELGYMDIDLNVSKQDSPARLNFSGAYWMLGAAARFALFDNVKDGQSNPSVFFMEFMSGLTEDAATDVIGSAKLGFNFGEFDHLRIGIHAGAQYIGLNKEQGFINNSNNYWFTYGLELGYRF